MPRQLITVDKRHNTHALIEASGAFAMHLIDELSSIWSGVSGCSPAATSTSLPAWRFSRERPEARCWPRHWPGSTAGSNRAWTRATGRSTWPPSSTAGSSEPTALTNRRFFDIAPPDKQKIMDEQYEHDAHLDAPSIQRWRDERVKN